MHLQISAWVWS